jgi:hypothetical protein
MPVFMKMNGIDSVGGTHSARDGTSNTLMIMEKVPAAPSPGPPAANFGNAGGEAEIGVRKGEWILDWTRDGGASHGNVDAFPTETVSTAEAVHLSEDAYAGAHALYQDVVII